MRAQTMIWVGCNHWLSQPDTSGGRHHAGDVLVFGTAIGADVHLGLRLDGSRSTDTSGHPLAYRWTWARLPRGSQATLRDATSVAPSFVVDVLGVDS